MMKQTVAAPTPLVKWHEHQVNVSMTKSAQAVAGPGPALLTRAIDTRKLARARVAGVLGVTRQHISVLCNGDAVPSLDLAVGIEELLGVPARSWVRKTATARYTAKQLEAA
jgi:plasmid maintenance system antidote protein VapI